MRPPGKRLRLAWDQKGGDGLRRSVDRYSKDSPPYSQYINQNNHHWNKNPDEVVGWAFWNDPRHFWKTYPEPQPAYLLADHFSAVAWHGKWGHLHWAEREEVGDGLGELFSKVCLQKSWVGGFWVDSCCSGKAGVGKVSSAVQRAWQYRTIIINSHQFELSRVSVQTERYILSVSCESMFWVRNTSCSLKQTWRWDPWSLERWRPPKPLAN